VLCRAERRRQIARARSIHLFDKQEKTLDSAEKVFYAIAYESGSGA
jgi:hypothetical protein